MIENLNWNGATGWEVSILLTAVQFRPDVGTSDN